MQRERVGFVYDACCLSFQNKHKRNLIGISCIYIWIRIPSYIQVI
jgi:hypothetical protein